MFPKKGQVFQKGWTTSTPTVTDGWVFQKILPLKLAGNCLFSCFWQELGFSVKNNNSAEWADFLSAFYFYVRGLIVLVRATLSPIIHSFTSCCAWRGVWQMLLQVWSPALVPQYVKISWRSSRTGACAGCDVVDRALECAAAIQVFLDKFLFRFLEWAKLWDTWFGIPSTWSSVGERLHLWLFTARIESAQPSQSQAVFICIWALGNWNFGTWGCLPKCVL